MAAFLSCADNGRGQPGGGPLAPPPTACTLIGCEDGLKIELRPASGWPAGEYRFRIRADGAETTCRGSLPLTGCAEPSVVCEPEGMARIVESGCALPAGAHALPGIVLDPKLRPRQVAISITRDGRLVGQAELVPAFRRIQPNGPQCPPSCEVATAVIDLEL